MSDHAAGGHAASDHAASDHAVSDYDVVVLGEPLVERHVDADGRPNAPDAVSGDAFNAACAAALAGARVGLLTALGNDEGGDRVLAELTARGIGVEHIVRDDRPTGAYTIHPGPSGQPVFSYQRAGSAASALDPTALAPGNSGGWGSVLANAPVLLTGGIMAALTPGTEALVKAAVREAGGLVCFDVNFRPKLTAAADALRVLRAVASDCAVVKIGSPGDSGPLLGLTGPGEVATAVGALTGGTVVVTAGEQPLVVATPDGRISHPVRPSPGFVDPTGAGDVLIGTLAARLALGDPLTAALPEAMTAAALSTAHRGGAPRATRAEVLARLGRA